MSDALSEWRGMSEETRQMICNRLVQAPIVRRVLEEIAPGSDLTPLPLREQLDHDVDRMILDEIVQASLPSDPIDNYTPRPNEVRGVAGVAWERHKTGWHAELDLITLEVEDSGDWVAAYDGDAEADTADSVEQAKRDCVEAARVLHRRGLAGLDGLEPIREVSGA